MVRGPEQGPQYTAEGAQVPILGHVLPCYSLFSQSRSRLRSPGYDRFRRRDASVYHDAYRGRHSRPHGDLGRMVVAVLLQGHQVTFGPAIILGQGLVLIIVLDRGLVLDQGRVLAIIPGQGLALVGTILQP